MFEHAIRHVTRRRRRTSDEIWKVTPTDWRMRRGESITLGGKGSMRWASVDIGDHIVAVLVFGETKAIANARAREIVLGVQTVQRRRAQKRRAIERKAP